MDLSSHPQKEPPTQQSTSSKRNRVPLSCFPCRASKQRCDRARPSCGQCQRKAQPGRCRYAPPIEKRPRRRGNNNKGTRGGGGMAARLERLEGMVRTMIEAQVEGDEENDDDEGEEVEEEDDGGLGMDGKVVRGERATSYVGATHFMAILEDIEDLKAYFDDPEEPEGELHPSFEDMETTSEMLLFSAGTWRSKEELLAMLPDRTVADRLIMRYFGIYSTSQHIIHRPTFAKSYSQFWQDPQKAPMHWIALLFMMLSLGVFFSSFTAPEELQADSPDVDPIDRVKLYRSAAGWALVYGKYLQPGPLTLQPFLLFVESELLLNRANPTSCYMLMAVLIRMMLKMGLHRDPSKLPNIGPYEGEMRRRIWSLANTVDLLVSFHVGLPSMIQAVPSDTQMPRNILDEDFDETSAELPAPRPLSEYTHITYPIVKCTLAKVFGKVAAHLHSLTPPSYPEVLQLDLLITDTWKAIPSGMKIRPLGESVTDSPHQAIQRFGLACLYDKSRCVLHRQYLTEAIPKREHDYSRKVCIESALNLLCHQNSLFDATQPGHTLSPSTWFVSSIATHDFLLAGMVVYMVIESPHYAEIGGTEGWPSKEELLQLLKRSHSIWHAMSRNVQEVKKTADIIGTMLRKLGVEVPNIVAEAPMQTDGAHATQSAPRTSMSDASMQPDVNMLPMASLSTSDQGQLNIGTAVPSLRGSSGSASSSAAPQSCSLDMSTPLELDSSWGAVDNGVDWKTFETLVIQVQSQANTSEVDQTIAPWLARSPNPMYDFDFTGGAWEDNLNTQL